ncbi:unnamed protein product, partial [Ixodes hexagonus]
SIPLSAGASAASATPTATIGVSTTTTTRIAATTATSLATTVTETFSMADAPRAVITTVVPPSRVGRAVFHHLRPVATTPVTAAVSTSATVATASTILARAAATSATPASTDSSASVATSATSSTSTTSVPATSSSAAPAAATGASSPRDLSPYRYQTVFKHVLFGRRARQIVMNVYSRLRLEYPLASYNDIVKQTTHFTGVAHATIFSWKKIVDLGDDDKKPPPKARQRRKNASSSPRSEAKRGRKTSRKEGPGSENQAVPKKVQRKKLAPLDSTQASQVAKPRPRQGKVQRKKLVTLVNEDTEVARQPVRAGKTQLKKVNPVERPPSQETTRHVTCPEYQANKGTTMYQEPWKGGHTQRTAVGQASQAAMTYAEPWRGQPNQPIPYKRHTDQAGAMPYEQGRDPRGQSTCYEQPPTSQANALAAGACNQPFRCEQHASQAGTSGEPRTLNQCRVWWASQ